QVEEEVEIWARGLDPHQDDFQVRFAHERPLINAQDISRHPRGLAGVIAECRRANAKHEMFLSLLVSSLQLRDRPLRNRFLDVVSALEAYDAQTFGEGPMSLDAFRAKRKDVLSAAKGAGIAKADMSFLKRWLLNRPSVS